MASDPDTAVHGHQIERLIAPEAAIAFSGSRHDHAYDRCWEFSAVMQKSRPKTRSTLRSHHERLAKKAKDLASDADACLPAQVRGQVRAIEYAPSVPGVFVCGAMRLGQSLVVSAIREGRQTARSVDEALVGASELPR